MFSSSILRRHRPGAQAARLLGLAALALLPLGGFSQTASAQKKAPEWPCYSCSPDYVMGGVARDGKTLGQLAQKSLNLLSDADGHFMGNLYGFCMTFGKGERFTRTMRKKWLADMEKRLAPTGAVDPYFVEAGCNPSNIGATFSPLAHIAAELPIDRHEQLVIIEKYFVEKGKQGLLAKMLNARNTQGMTTLDYVNYLKEKESYGVVATPEIVAATEKFVDYLCANGADYSPHVDACNKADYAANYKSLKIRADAGDVEKLVQLAEVHRRGRLGMPMDLRKALSYYQAAASSGTRESKQDLASLYAGEYLWSDMSALADMSEALKIWKELGNSSAVAAAYAKGGKNVPRNVQQAYVWYEKAYREGSHSAVTGLLDIAWKEKDNALAFKWLKIGVADPNFDHEERSKLMHQLAAHYKDGNATAQNESEFLRLRYACAIDNRMFRRLDDAWVLSDRPVFERLARQGDARAMFLAGFYYTRVDRGIRDPDKSVYWYRKAAEMNDPHAQLALAWIYSDGNGVDRDMSASKRWFTRAAAQGLPQAQEKLANWKDE